MAKENFGSTYQHIFFPWPKSTFSHSISIAGLIEAGKNIIIWLSKAFLVIVLSFSLAFLFWYIRAQIPYLIDSSYKSYAIWIDSAIFGTVPSLLIQKYIHSEFLDNFLRWIWLSYSFVILFGSTLAFILRADTKRHLLSVFLTLSTGLLVHFLLPTEPPWMAVDGVVRINGDYFSKLDKNLVAAMPSIHQAIVCLFGCILWNFGFWGKAVSIFYNFIMLVALVYLGEHYVVDSLAGIFIAILFWVLSKRILSKFSDLRRCHIQVYQRKGTEN